VKIVYSEKYLKYHFGPGHPFWPERAAKFLKLLRSKSKFKYKIVEAPKAKDSDILLVHTEKYLQKVKKLAKEKGYLSVDTQVNPDNLEAAYYSVGGTIKAFEIALKGEIAVNTLGGLHHAETNNSSGFCIFNDHAIAIRKMQKSYRENPKLQISNSKQIQNSKSQYSKRSRKLGIKTAVVLDIDVHAGNGTQEIFYSDSTVLTISIHQDPTFFYPGTGFASQIGEGKGRGFNLNVPLAPGTEEKEYLETLDKALPKIKKFKPDILVVVFGADTYKDDPLASFRLEKNTYGKIADRLKKLGTQEPHSTKTSRGKLNNLPMVILFAGGYSKDVPEIWYEFVSKLV
jgi:acetoin utilization protein AcuC